MKEEYKKKLLHDYRDDIVSRKRKSKWINWAEWKNWDILYKTMAYEISCSKDVESYGYVREDIFNIPGNELVRVVGECPTADIMNGWWYCFKTIFKIDKSRKQSNKIEEKIMKDILEGKNIYESYGIELDLYQEFTSYLKLVYTIGNMTPVPKKCNTYENFLDNWEYKLYSHKEKYGENYIDKLHFEDYNDKNKITKEKFLNDPKSYIKNRIELIIKRGYRIVSNGDIISENDLKEIRESIKDE